MAKNQVDISTNERLQLNGDSINSGTIDRKFGRPEDFIELHIYNQSDQLLSSDYNFTKYKFPEGTTENEVSELNMDPVDILRLKGYTSGQYKLIFNIQRSKIFNTSTLPFSVKEISSTRRELKSVTPKLTNNQLDPEVSRFIREIEVAPYLKDFVLNVKDPELSLRQAIESALRHVVGDNTLEQTLTVGREQIAQEVQGRLQQILNNYETGLLVQQVNIEKTDPPAAVKDAFDDVVAAREDKEKLQNEAQRYALTIVPEARGQAQARIRNAEGYLLEVVANAEGEVGRFTQLLKEYEKAPQVTRDRMYIDAMQSVLSNTTKVMIDVDNGNNLMLLPLDKMMQNSSRPSSLNDILNRKGDNNE